MLEKNITGYCDKLCAAPGEVIHFKVSCDKPLSYRADVVRILCGDDHEGAPGLREITLDTSAWVRRSGRILSVDSQCPLSTPVHVLWITFAACVQFGRRFKPMFDHTIMGVFINSDSSIPSSIRGLLCILISHLSCGSQ